MRWVKALSITLLATATLLSACAPAAGPQLVAPPTAPVALLTPAPKSDGRPSLVPAACAHVLPPDLKEGESIVCGHVRVPQNRTWPDDLWLELPYSMIRRSNTSAPPREPLLFLTGGSAGSALAHFAEVYQALLPFRAERDIVLYEPRGLKLASPNLDCQPYAGQLDLATAHAKWDAAVAEAYRPVPDALVGLPACAAALAQRGIDLVYYDTENNAHDAADLMRALGFERYDLYAVSNGTRVALELMRVWPGNIHAVVLDSTLPPSVNVYETQLAEARYEVAMRVFDQCAANAACNTSFPRLKARYADLVVRLNRAPIALGLAGQPTLSGDDLMQVLLNRLTPDNVSFVPLMIHELDLGETRMLLRVLQNQLPTSEPPLAAPAEPMGSEGLGTRQLPLITAGSIAELAGACRDEWTFNQFYVALAAHKALSIPDRLVTADLAALRAWGAACALLPTGKALLRQSEAVKSEIPTLIYQGLLDSTTPPSWAAVARKTLSQHYYFEFPGQPHNILRQPLTLKTGCATRMAIQFFDAPARPPDGECIQPNYGFAFVIEGRDPSVVASAPHSRD